MSAPNEVTEEMVAAGLCELSVICDDVAAASKVTSADLRAVYIAMRRLETAPSVTLEFTNVDTGDGTLPRTASRLIVELRPTRHARHSSAVEESGM